MNTKCPGCGCPVEKMENYSDHNDGCPWLISFNICAKGALDINDRFRTANQNWRKHWHPEVGDLVSHFASTSFYEIIGIHRETKVAHEGFIFKNCEDHLYLKNECFPYFAIHANWRTGKSNCKRWNYGTPFLLTARVFVNGTKVDGQICAFQEGPHGFIERYFLGADGAPRINERGDDVLIERLVGHVEFRDAPLGEMDERAAHTRRILDADTKGAARAAESIEAQIGNHHKTGINAFYCEEALLKEKARMARLRYLNALDSLRGGR